MANYIASDTDLAAVADAIRAKSGGSGQLSFPSGFVDEIDSISSGGYTDDEYAANTAPRGEMNISCSIGELVFSKNNGITKVTQTAGGCNARAFRTCESIQYFIGKGTTFFYAQVFKECSNLEAVDIGGAYDWRFETENFGQCSKMATLIIRKEAVVALGGGVNTFISTPFASAGAGGILYVPQSVLSDYESATNWSTVLGYTNNQILPIEGSYYETHYADGTPIPTT